MDDTWKAFGRSGAVHDYLSYKENEKVSDEGNHYQGLSNKATDNRGE